MWFRGLGSLQMQQQQSSQQSQVLQAAGLTQESRQPFTHHQVTITLSTTHAVCVGGGVQISVAYYKFAPQIIRVPVNWI